MYGVVLWSDPQKRQAVVWCSDHGDLAYVQSRDCMDAEGDLPKAGTSCVIEFHNQNGLRVCKKLTPMTEEALPDLPNILHNEAKPHTADAPKGNPPLPRKTARPAASHKRVDTRSIPVNAANCDKAIIPKSG